ncbi:hypothetical protein F53441_13230 [Fusarium austroafricanum]|uniref:Peptidase C14 caspase domain-containing protein n=1 Tax=Fusarium austroafricanum TaxID=2364996 RepID=A0A8H4JT30_9HYPO|nr:hypothetical protein F53441_13230 [Fusarium austroafricanum]
MSKPEVTKRAVLIGIDHYERPSALPPRTNTNGGDIHYNNLRGCVNDALATREYLVNTMKVDPSHIDTLLAPVPGSKRPFPFPDEAYREPTYKNITSALEDVARISSKGDFVYIHYSGHGACATTMFGDLREDIDHCLVPYDIAHGGKYLRDLEFGALLQDIVEKGVLLTVVLDSCYSGGAVRAGEGEDSDDEEEEGVRAVKGIYASNPALDVPDSMEKIRHWSHKASWMECPEGFVVLAACLESQKAKEFPARSPRYAGVYKHGYLTYWLLDTLRNTSANLPSRAIYDRTRAKLSERVSDQTPYIVGDQDSFFFNKGVRSRIYALTVLKVDTRQRNLSKRCLYLWGGTMDGVQRHSVYAILPLDYDLRTSISQSDVLARVRVVAIKSGECQTTFLQPENMSDGQWNKLTPGCPAVLLKLPLVGRSRVRFRAADSDQELQFKDKWEGHVGEDARLRLVQDDDGEDSFEVHVDKSSCFQITDPAGSFPSYISDMLDPLDWDDDESVPRLVSRLEHLSRLKLVKGLENPGIRTGNVSELISVSVGPSDKKMSSENEYHDPHKQYPPAKTIERTKDGVYEVLPDVWFRLRITNNTDRPVGCVVLAFNQELGISRVFPHTNIGPFKSIDAGDSVNADLIMSVPDSLLNAVDAGVPIVDVFKVFVSRPQRDFDAMQLEKLTVVDGDGYRADSPDGDESLDSLDELLGKLGPLTREAAGPAHIEKWDSDWQTLDVHVRLLLNTQ